MTKRTFQPHSKSKKRTSGFLKRSSSPAGRKILKNRRKKGRHKLVP